MTRFTNIRWGDLALDDVQVSTSRARGLLAQLPARGTGGFVQDRGPELRECRVTVQWTKRHKDDDPVARYRKLLALHDGKTRLFVHPLDGAFPAKLSIEDESIQAGQVDAVLRFVEDRGHARPAPGKQTAHAAIEAVQQRAQDAKAALEAAGLPAKVADESRELAASWAEASPPAAEVHTGLSRQTAAIGDFVQASGAERDPAKLDAYFALLALSASLADAAEIVTASSPSLIELEIAEPVTLLSLSAALYGGQEAARRAREIMQLNLLRSANVIAAGTTLTVPSV